MHTTASQKPRSESPAASSADLAELVAGSSAFALDLYRLLSQRAAGNLFYSPYSISLALAMTYAGARGETEGQMASTLHFTLPQARLHPAGNALDLALAKRGQQPWRENGATFNLTISSAIWGQEGQQFLPAFLDTLAENYGAGLRLVDFTGAPQAARQTINAWVSEQTEERIQDLIAPGVIDSLTRLVLTNAIYFYAAWANPFQQAVTSDGPFYLLDNNTVTVPMMRQTESFAYTEGNGYQALELPYDGREVAMLILLPAPGAFTAFERALDDGRLQGIVQDLVSQRTALTMPRFKFASEFMLKPALAALGMPLAFSDGADFSGMDGSHWLCIKDVIHKAFVAVDEAGTEAAAATAVVMGLKSMPNFEDPVIFTLDRPFIFFIRDIATGSILFAGRVANPRVG